MTKTLAGCQATTAVLTLDFTIFLRYNTHSPIELPIHEAVPDFATWVQMISAGSIANDAETPHKRQFPAPEVPGMSFLVAGAGFEPATFGLCLPLQLSLPYEVCGLDFPFTLSSSNSKAVRVPAIKSLHLL